MYEKKRYTTKSSIIINTKLVSSFVIYFSKTKRLINQKIIINSLLLYIKLKNYSTYKRYTPIFKGYLFINK